MAIELSYFLKLRDERDELAERVRQLEAVLRDDSWQPKEWGLTPSEAAIVNILTMRRVATREAIFVALYGDDVDGGPLERTIDVLVCKLRPKLRRHGFTVQNVYGAGYRLDDAARATFTKLKQAA